MPSTGYIYNPYCLEIIHCFFTVNKHLRFHPSPRSKCAWFVGRCMICRCACAPRLEGFWIRLLTDRWPEKNGGKTPKPWDWKSWSRSWVRLLYFLGCSCTLPSTVGLKRVSGKCKSILLLRGLVFKSAQIHSLHFWRWRLNVKTAILNCLRMIVKEVVKKNWNPPTCIEDLRWRFNGMFDMLMDFFTCWGTTSSSLHIHQITMLLWGMNGIARYFFQIRGKNPPRKSLPESFWMMINPNPAKPFKMLRLVNQPMKIGDRLDFHRGPKHSPWPVGFAGLLLLYSHHGSCNWWVCFHSSWI